MVALIGVAFLPADWLEDLTGWVLEPYWILPAAILVLLLAGALLCRQIVLNRSRARAEEDEIAMSRGDLATEELRRQEESESERPGS